MAKAYQVEVDKIGCEHCAAYREWTVVGPGEVAIGQSFEDKDAADDLAAYMNEAYEAGKLAPPEEPQ